jgi:hypothetical protein
MRHVILLSLATFSAFVIGCSAPAAKQTTTPAAMTYSADCPPPPGGETQFTFEDAPKGETTKSNNAAASYRPNVQERPSRGAVHAAY